MQLTIASEAQMVEQAQQLIQRVQAEQTSILPKDDIIDVVTTIVVYKFANKSRQEVEAMLGIDLEQTRVYQEAEAEGRQKLKLELVPQLLARGITQQEVADLLGLTLAQVRIAAQEQSQE